MPPYVDFGVENSFAYGAVSIEAGQRKSGTPGK
jgi:hypothetical protein